MDALIDEREDDVSTAAAVDADVEPVANVEGIEQADQGQDEQVIVTEYIESNMLDSISVQFLGEDVVDTSLHDRVLKSGLDGKRAVRQPAKKRERKPYEKPLAICKSKTKKAVVHPKEVRDLERKVNERLRSVESGMMKRWKKTLRDGDKILCPVEGCAMMYGSIPGIRTHYQTCTGNSKSQGTFKCSKCSLVFNFERMLKRHETLVHSRVNEVEPIESLEDAVRFILPEESRAHELSEGMIGRQSSFMSLEDECDDAVNENEEDNDQSYENQRAMQLDDSTVVIAQQVNDDSEAANSNYQIVSYVSNEEGYPQNLSLFCDGNVVNVEVPQANGAGSNLIVLHWEVPVALEELMTTVESAEGTAQQCDDEITNNTNEMQGKAVATNGRSRGRGRGRGSGRGSRRGGGSGSLRSVNAEDVDPFVADEKPRIKVTRYSRRNGLRSSLPNDVASIDPAIFASQDQLAANDSVAIDNQEVTSVPKRKRRPRLNASAPKPVEIVKCGVCLENYEGEKKFQIHAMQQHNGLARRFGDDQEFSAIDKRHTLLNTLKKVGRIRCLRNDCNRKSFTTLPGYLYHERACGKVMKDRTVPCELCGKILVPESLSNHMKTFHPPTPPPTEQSDFVDDALPSIFEESGPKVTRAAAKKALKTVSRLVNEKYDDMSPPRPVEDGDSDGDFILEMAEGDEEMELEDYDDDADCDFGVGELVGHENIPSSRLYAKPKKIHVTKEMFSDWRDELKRDGNVPCRNAGCDYVGDNIKKVEYHYKSCKRSLHGGLYTCVVCQFASVTEAKMLNHVLAHKNRFGRSPAVAAKSMEYLCRISVPEELRRRKASKVPAPQRVYKAIRSGEFGTKFFKPHFDFTIQFCRAHYTRRPDVVFSSWRSSAADWRLVPREERQTYLPKCDESVPIKSSFRANDADDFVGDQQFRRVRLFESTQHEGIADATSCFLGGPVWALSWCPTPNEIPNCRQFFAAACHGDQEMTHTYKDCGRQHGLIQIWDAGILETSVEPITKPSLALGIAHDHGTVWSIVWCPSGCWQDPDGQVTPRLGVMAVAFADGLVRIYSVPHPHSLVYSSANDDDHHHSVYVGRPVAVLELHGERVDSSTFQATALSWLQSKGHGLLAVGYTNGFIGVFDLTTTSPLLRESIGAGPGRIKCYQMFQAHGSVVTGLDFAHSQCGSHLVSVGRDRCLKFWDLRDTSLPYNVVKKSWFTCAFWMPHWCGACVSSDDALSLVASGTNYYECGYYGENCGTLLAHNSNVWDASPSYWFNSIVSCDGAGEVAICVMGQLMQLYASLKSANYRRLPLYRFEAERKCDEVSLTTTTSSSSVPKPRTYAEASRFYNLNIKDQPLWDLKKISIDEIKHVSCDTHMLESAVDEFPLISVNRVAWNSNLGSHLWVASGCQSGLVRLVCIAGLKDVLPVDSLRTKLLASAEPAVQ